MNKKLVIIGAGPAGLAATIGAINGGISPDDVLILERESELGGVLNQCVHDGFGEYNLGQSLTGTEYAEHYIKQVEALGVPYLTDSTVLSISSDKEITFVSSSLGYTSVKAEAIILAMGCRELSHGSLRIAGTRPAGIFSAGTVQRFINIEGQLPGKRVVLFGSGDIGLVAARRLTIEGAQVISAYERKPYATGSQRNIKECLTDFGIPFYTGKTVSKIIGKERVEGVVISSVDKDLQIIKGTEELVKCDTLVLSLGLVPDITIGSDAGIEVDRESCGPVVNQYFQTSKDGVFACGNALHIHDLVDYITIEATTTGRHAAAYLLNKIPATKKELPLSHNSEIKYTVPHKFVFPMNGRVRSNVLYYRASRAMKNAKIELKADGKAIYCILKSRLTPSQMHFIPLDSDLLYQLENAESICLEAMEV